MTFKCLIWSFKIFYSHICWEVDLESLPRHCRGWVTLCWTLQSESLSFPYHVGWGAWPNCDGGHRLHLQHGNGSDWASIILSCADVRAFFISLYLVEPGNNWLCKYDTVILSEKSMYQSHFLSLFIFRVILRCGTKSTGNKSKNQKREKELQCAQLQYIHTHNT